MCQNKYDKHYFERFKKKHETTVEEEEIVSETPRKLTRSSFDSINFQVWCIFCNKSDGSLRKARSFAIDNRVRQAAILLGNNKLIAQLSEGDMHTIEARYHQFQTIPNSQFQISSKQFINAFANDIRRNKYYSF